MRIEFTGREQAPFLCKHIILFTLINFARSFPRLYSVKGLEVLGRMEDGRLLPTVPTVGLQYSVKLATKKGLAKYLEEDWVERFLISHAEEIHGKLTCTQWLLESPPKRYLFSDLYKDFAYGFTGRVLDVGGGLTAFTPVFANQFDYELLDLMHHDDPQLVRSMTESVPKGAIHTLDWQEFVPSGNYDVVVANDLFPNVDQRLGDFLEKFLPLSREIRLSLTYYNNRRCYKVKRVDGEEIFFMRPWDGYRLSRELQLFKDRIVEPDFDFLELSEPSLFPNGRQVCVVTVKGDIESV